MEALQEINGNGIVSFVIKVDGNPIPDTMGVLSVYIERNVNRISMAKIVILDGDAETGTFEISSSSTWVPGSEVSIQAGYDSNNTLLFKGIITGQSIRLDEFTGGTLQVECRDAAIRMTVARNSAVFSQKKDSDIFDSIIESYQGLSANVTPTKTVWPQQVQHYVSDWDFIVTRAEVNGMLVTTADGIISVTRPDAEPAPALTARYGDNLLSFNAQLNAISQTGNVRADSWNFTDQAINSVDVVTENKGPGNLSSKKLSKLMALPADRLQTTASISNAELSAWAKAQVTKKVYSKIQGQAKLQGTSLVVPGKHIRLEGVGDRFNGDHFVSGVVHTISDGNWITELSIGISPTWFNEEKDVMAAPASGLLPAVRGLFNGTVKNMCDDPDGQFRILVDIPMFDANSEGVWARLSNFYSTNGAGAFFLPEVGDEVIVGFLNEDPRHPVILGSMYSSQKFPFYGLKPNEKNSIKAIISKSGISISFDDENKVISIKTPGGSSVTLSDEEKCISIQDQHLNKVIMSVDGITLRSNGDLNLEAAKKINIKGNGINIESPGGDVNVHGVNIIEKAGNTYSAQANAVAQIKASGQVNINGAMVMIN